MWITCEYIVFLFLLVNLVQKTYYADPFTYFKVKNEKNIPAKSNKKSKNTWL
jgi:hypothetical protein